MEIVGKTWNGFHVLEILGRIDGLTSVGLKRSVDQAATHGMRNLVLDFTGVSYMSSAGLRVILQSHLALRKIGGTLTMVSVPPAIMEVFHVSGMGNYLQFAEEMNLLTTVARPEKEAAEIVDIEIDNNRFESLKTSCIHGEFFSFGSTDKLLKAAYGPADTISIPSPEIAFALGLAALGEDYSDFKNFFGETVVLGHHFFSFPAVIKPVVDYSYYGHGSKHSFNFLYGTGINGPFAQILRFDQRYQPLNISTLLNAASKVAETNLFGVVIMGVSGGIDGMNLKKSPILENQPGSGQIFDNVNFPNWMNFSVASEDFNKTIVAFGVVIKDTGVINPKLKEILPVNGNAHLHAVVFENGLWSNNIMEFEHELYRIVQEFEPEKVLHVLPESKLKSGYIGIINVEAN